MSIGAFVLFASIVFFASVVQGISGFAFGLIVLMVFPHLFGYSDALVLANLMTLVLLIYNSFLYRRYCAWKWLPVGVSVFAVTDLLGVLVLKRVGDSPIWYTLLGVMFILMAVYMMWGQNKLHIRANQVTLAIFFGCDWTVDRCICRWRTYYGRVFYGSLPKQRRIFGNHSGVVIVWHGAGYGFSHRQWHGDVGTCW